MKMPIFEFMRGNCKNCEIKHVTEIQDLQQI